MHKPTHTLPKQAYCYKIKNTAETPTNSHSPISIILKREGVRHRPGELLVELTSHGSNEIAGH